MTTRLGSLPAPQLQTAHDVRHLCGCANCGQLGMDTTMVDLDGEWFHGRCFVRKFGLRYLLALPRSKKLRLTLGDVGVKTMQALLDSVASQSTKTSEPK